MKLSELNINEHAIISKVKGAKKFRKRLIDMGFIPGKKIKTIKKAPFNGPVEYQIMGYTITIRRCDAEMIELIDFEQTEKPKLSFQRMSFPDSDSHQNKTNKYKSIHIALLGNPNAGKTTLFNKITGLSERASNYGGVTIDAKETQFEYDGYSITLVDLPGTYSLSSYQEEELKVRKYLIDKQPDIVLNVVDATHLERNLNLTCHLIDMDLKVVAALNMYDEMIVNRDRFDNKLFGKMTGIPFIPTVATKGKGIAAIMKKIIDVFEDKDDTVRHIHINYGFAIEESIQLLQNEIRKDGNRFITSKISPRFISLKLLENDPSIQERLKECSNYENLHNLAEKKTKELEKDNNEDVEEQINNAKYGFISGALNETLKTGFRKISENSKLIDSYVLHKIWSIPVFFSIIWLIFYSTFTLGKYPQTWIEQIIDYLSFALNNHLPESVIKDLIIDGVIGGVGGVIVFLPNIVILFFFIALLEDSGYLARTVYIMDKVMHKFGLHGKSFIPLIMGFGCNVPAIMATRFIESKRDRIITMLINSFMTCSARLPVYVVFIGAFFVANQGSMLFLIYAIGIVIALISAIIFNRTILRGHDTPFVMELPPYRMPLLRTVTKHMWMRTSHYLKKMGGVILIASVILWILGYFPRNVDFSKDYDSLITHHEKELSISSDHKRADTLLQIDAIKHLIIEKEGERLQQSYIGKIGKTIEPVFRPLGFDWKMSICLLSGIAAKEIIVSSMGVLFQADPDINQGNNSLTNKLKEQRHTEGPLIGEKIFSPLKAFSFMLFILLYFPCLASLIAIKKESGSWKWVTLAVIYSTVVAYIVSFSVYSIGNMIM